MMSRKMIRLGSALVTFLFLFFQVATQASPIRTGSLASQSDQPLSSVSIGFSPSTLEPIIDGVPVYSIFDNLWVFQNSNVPLFLQVFSPSSQDSFPANKSVVSVYIPSGVAQIVYKFSTFDFEGTWLLNATFEASPPISYIIPLIFVNPDLHPISGSLASYSLFKDELLSTFAVNSGEFNNLEGCILPMFPAENMALIPLPSSLGSGSIELTDLNLDSNNATVVLSGSASNPFDFWFELKTSYSYSSAFPNSTGITTRVQTVARSDTIAFSTSSNAQQIFSTKIAGINPMRPGRYWIDGFFSSSLGTQFEEVRVSIVSSSEMISLGSECEALGSFSSSIFSTTFSLSKPTSQWPFSLLIMAQDRGVETLNFLPINLGLAKINLLSSPWGITPPDISIEIPQGNGSTQSSSPQCLGQNLNLLYSSIYNGTIYLIASHYPVTVEYCLSFGGKLISNESTTLDSPYTAVEQNITLGKISAEVTDNGKPVSGAEVIVLNQRLDANESKATDSSGGAVFYVPTGTYKVIAFLGSSNISKSFEIASGANEIAQFSFTTSGPSSSPAIDPDFYLIALAVVGVLLNLWAWIFRPRLALRRLTRS
jgi:hypothetical protein